MLDLSRQLEDEVRIEVLTCRSIEKLRTVGRAKALKVSHRGIVVNPHEGQLAAVLEVIQTEVASLLTENEL